METPPIILDDFYYGVEPPTVELTEIAFSEILLLMALDEVLDEAAGISTCKDSLRTFTRLTF